MPELVSEIAEMLTDITGEDAVTAATTLEADLRLESIELAVFADRLRQRYGESVDLAAFCADLDIDELIGLTVSDVANYVARRT